MKRKRLQTNLGGGLLVFLTTFVVFLVSSVHSISDSKYSVLFSQQLWQHQSFSVNRETFPELESTKPGDVLAPGHAALYQIEQVGERFYYAYPIGTTILSVPYVALMNTLGVSASDGNGRYDHTGERNIQVGLAAVLMAGLAVVIFLTSRLLLPFEWSVVIALTTAFGTQVWSTASRALWAHTWGIFIVGWVIWMLLRAEVRQIRLRPLLLATCLSWLYFVRPTFSVAVIAITIYVLIYHRAIFIPYALTGAAWLALFIGYSRYHFGQTLPFYYTLPLTFEVFWEAIAGNLISPSRGLFIYSPILAFVLYLLLRYRSVLIMPRLVALAFGAIILHLVVIAGFTPWHGGHCYGPRLSTDLVPWFALLGILAVKTRLEWHETNPSASLLRWRAEWALGTTLLLVSITLHGIGATSQRPWRWLIVPANIDATPKRVWDWRHPQFIGVSREEVRPTPEPARPSPPP